MYQGICRVFLLFLLLWQTSAFADDKLQGRVEQRNTPARLTRPALPARPPGDAFDHVSSGSPNHHQSGFNLSASSVSDLLDKQSFSFNCHAEGKQQGISDQADTRHPDKNERNLSAGLDTNDRELIIAWDEWHRRLSANLYHQWLSYGTVPGEGTVILHITRDGGIDLELKDFRVNLFEEFSPEQRELFHQCLNLTVQALQHSNALTFPERSQRKDVTLGTKFTYTEQENVPQGYTWKKGDYERVIEPH